MSLARATALLWVAGIRNRFRRQLQRMRQPKYLIATLVGASYFWMVFGRRVRFGGSRMQLPSEVLGFMELPLILIAMTSIIATWLLGGDKAELSFTEAEIQFLFPAPASRRMLLNYRLSKSLVRTLLSALIMTFFSAGWITGHPAMFLVGVWLCLATLNLHLTGASLTRASLIEGGRFGLKRRLGTLAVALAAVGALAWWVVAAHKPDIPDTWTFQSALSWISALLSSPPLSWVLFPVRAPIHVALARDLATFLSALPAAVAIAAIHYAWVLSSNVSFEDASLEAAERRARALEARRTGRGRSLAGSKNRLVPFRLLPAGRPEVALIWKNMIAAMRVSMPRMLVFLLAMGIASSASLMKRFPVSPVIGAACAILTPVVALLGPNVMRLDLRHDLAQIDILRSFPMSGREVVRAELLGPGLILALLQWLLLTVAVVISASFQISGFELPKRIAVAGSVAMIAPAMALANLCIQNAGVLLFPSWVSVEPAQARGIEAFGQRLLSLAGSMIVFFFALLPASMLGGITFFLLWKGLGLDKYLALPIASAIAAGVIVAELQLAVRWLGALFDRFDVTAP